MDNYVWREALDDILKDVLTEYLPGDLADTILQEINMRIDSECTEDDEE